MPGQAAQSNRNNSGPIQDYVTVAERIEKFHERYPEGRIITHIIEHDGERGFILIRAEVYRNSDDAMPAATGHAYELKTEGYVQRTSYIEVCETSSVGRALANAGFEVKRGLAPRDRPASAARPQAVAQSQPKEAGPQEPAGYSEKHWLAGDIVSKEITDLENEVEARTKQGVHSLRQFTRDKFGVAGPYECEARQLNMYKAWLKSLK